MGSAKPVCLRPRTNLSRGKKLLVKSGLKQRNIVVKGNCGLIDYVIREIFFNNSRHQIYFRHSVFSKQTYFSKRMFQNLRFASRLTDAVVYFKTQSVPMRDIFNFIVRFYIRSLLWFTSQ